MDKITYTTVYRKIRSVEVYETEIQRDVDKAYDVYKKTKSKTAKDRYLKLAKEYNDLYKDELYKIRV